MINYEFIRSKRKTIGITVRRDGSVVVRAPYLCSRRHADEFVMSKLSWIEKCQAKMAERSQVPTLPKFTAEELSNLRMTAKRELPSLVDSVASEMGLSYGRLSFRFQKTLWGSCSGKGNLSFNCLLMLLPKEIQRYVVVHELCHRLEMNHSSRFWSLVAKYDPSFKEHRSALRSLGRPLLERLPI